MAGRQFVRYSFSVNDSPPTLCLPLKVTLHDECVAIRDADDISVCYIYYDDGCPVRRSVRQRLTKEAAIEIGKAVARALTNAAGHWSGGRKSENGRVAGPSDAREPGSP